MPAPIFYAHRILKVMSQARRSGESQVLGPDAKSQVTIRCENGKPVEATQIVVSTQHYDENLSSHDIKAIVEPYVRKALPADWITKQTVWHVNPTGKFVIGGPDGDCGLTGRKIIVDTYGGAAPHGGGAFSGKDATKVDRSAAYAARYLAKNVVAAELADRCAIQIAYAIGIAKPLALYVDFYGTGKVAEARLEKSLDEVIGSHPARHPRASRPQPPDLCAYQRLWPFRPPAGAGRRLLLGAHRPRRRIALGGRIIRAGAQPLLLMAMRSSICTRLWRGWPLSL